MNRLERLHDAHLSLDEYINIAVKEIKKNIGSLGLLFGLFYLVIPIAVLIPFFNKFLELRPTFEVLSNRSTGLTEAQTAALMQALGELLLPFSLAFLILSITFTWLGVATPLLIERSIQGKQITALDALKTSLSKVPASMIVGFVGSLLVIIASIFLIIPGIYVGVCLTFTNAAISLRGRFIDAISYSLSLVRGQWWKTFFRLFLLGLIAFGIGIVIALLTWPLQLILLPIAPIGELLSNLISTFCGYLWSVVFIVMFLHFDYVRNPIL